MNTNEKTKQPEIFVAFTQDELILIRSKCKRDLKYYQSVMTDQLKADIKERYQEEINKLTNIIDKIKDILNQNYSNNVNYERTYLMKGHNNI